MSILEEKNATYHSIKILKGHQPVLLQQVLEVLFVSGTIWEHSGIDNKSGKLSKLTWR